MLILGILLLFIGVAEFDPITTTAVENKKVIANGEVYNPLEYPYVVYLEMTSSVSNGISSCTGTLISPIFVLTAAHCTVNYKASDIIVSKSYVSHMLKYMLNFKHHYTIIDISG